MHLVFIVLLGMIPLSLWPDIYASYYCRDTLIVCASNYVFSIVCTLMVAGFTGYLASVKEVDIAEEARSGKQIFHIFTRNFTIEHRLDTFRARIPFLNSIPSQYALRIPHHSKPMGSVKTTTRISHVHTFDAPGYSQDSSGISLGNSWLILIKVDLPCFKMNIAGVSLIRWFIWQCWDNLCEFRGQFEWLLDLFVLIYLGEQCDSVLRVYCLTIP